MANTNASPQRIPIFSRWLHIGAVSTSHQIRHENLLLLIKRAGTITAFATSIERSHSQVSQLKTRSKHSTTGEPREIGDDLARHIEQKLELGNGWMDQAHHSYLPAGITAQPVVREAPPKFNDWPFPNVSIRRYRSLSAEDQARIQGYVEAVVHQSETRLPNDAAPLNS